MYMDKQQYQNIYIDTCSVTILRGAIHMQQEVNKSLQVEAEDLLARVEYLESEK